MSASPSPNRVFVLSNDLSFTETARTQSLRGEVRYGDRSLMRLLIQPNLYAVSWDGPPIVSKFLAITSMRAGDIGECIVHMRDEAAYRKMPMRDVQSLVRDTDKPEIQFVRINTSVDDFTWSLTPPPLNSPNATGANVGLISNRWDVDFLIMYLMETTTADLYSSLSKLHGPISTFLNYYMQHEQHMYHDMQSSSIYSGSSV